VVLPGAWNVAILTPDGVRKRLLDLPEGTPVEVQVMLDRPGPHRVVSGGLVITPSPSSLDVGSTMMTEGNLRAACKLASKALKVLPETPVVAAGVNIRYHFDTLPDVVLEMVSSSFDEVLSDADFKIESGMTRRSLGLDGGRVNLEVAWGEPEGATLVLNFHRDSSDHDELMKWLEKIDDFFRVAEKLLSCMKVRVQPESEGTNEV
jgi:hypothetical protein